MGEGRGGHVIIIKLQYDVYLGGGGGNDMYTRVI